MGQNYFETTFLVSFLLFFSTVFSPANWRIACLIVILFMPEELARSSVCNAEAFYSSENQQEMTTE